MTPRRLLLLACFALSSAHALADDAPSPPTPSTHEAQAAALASIPAEDRRDEDFARRGFIASRSDPLIRDAKGDVLWDLRAWDYLQGERPDTVNPSLWRHARLMALHGLFQVSERMWQVRGFDLANMTLVRGHTGWIVIDTLGSVETARAALELANKELGSRPVTAVIYTHPHVDHFGGAAAVVSAAAAASGQVPVIAPQGFLPAAVGENLIAGPAMQRRAAYQFGVGLANSPTGSVNAGIGPGLAVGTSSLIPPNRQIQRTGEELTVDGVTMVFQITPGTEAPAEMNIQFPRWNIVDMAENANASQHNILTPRGAVVRDAKSWADHLTESIALFGDGDILVTSHGWPRFGRDDIRTYLSRHRDVYAFLHDQTVRLMNQGLNGDEIAARLKLPDALAREWYNRPYYGSLSFNARAVYQFYMGWYDANPVHLLPAPPVDTGRRYVQAMGGPDKVLAMAREAFGKGDYGWSAELLNRLVMSGDQPAARSLLAASYEQLAWQSENALWRNMYLSAASELRHGIVHRENPHAGSSAALANLPTASVFDLLAVRLDPQRAGASPMAVRFVFPDRSERVRVTVENGVLVHVAEQREAGPVDATVTMARADFLRLLATRSPDALSRATIDGDKGQVIRLLGCFEPPRGEFPIVTRER